MAATDLEAVEQDRSTTRSPSFSLFRETVFVAIVCNAQLLTQAGLGQAIAPLHIIGKTFGLEETSPKLSWFAAAYSLTVGTFILFAGRLGDIFGHRRLFIAGWAWYALWSLLAGFGTYTDQIFFDICRAFQGIGPAVLLPNALAILGRTYHPGPRKDMVFSIFGATAPGGFVLGAVFSSIFAQLSKWAWAYWTLAIVCAFLAFMSFLVIPPDEVVVSGIKLYMFDVGGTVTGVIGLVLLNVAWNQAAVVGWTVPYTYILLIVGIVALIAFAFIESRARQPLLPLKQFSSATLYVLGCIGAGWASFGIWVYYLWQFFEVLRGADPLLTTAFYCPVAISGCCAAIVTGFLLSRVSPSWIMLIAMTAFLVGNILVATAPVGQIYWAQTFVAILIMPWGMDMSFPSGTIVLSNGMPREQQGMAASIVNTVVNYSISLSLGIAGTVESQINPNGTDILKGYRSALYFSIGLAGLGMAVGAVAVFSELKDGKKEKEKMGSSA